MQREQLQAVQGPLKRRYQEDPGAALVTLSASGRLDGEGIACSVATGSLRARATCSCRRSSRARA